MNLKKLIIATIAGGIVMFLLAGLFHMMIPMIKDNYAAWMAEANPRRDMVEPIHFVMVVVSYVILALLMAYIYPLGYKGGSPIKEGFVFGALMGLLSRVPVALVVWSTLFVDKNWVITEGIWHMLEEGIGGIVIAFVYGKSTA